MLQNVKNSDILVAGLTGDQDSLKLPQVPRLCRTGSERYRKERIRRAIFVPRGELLCKVEYVSWHSKYVRLWTGEAKYIYMPYCVSHSSGPVVGQKIRHRVTHGFVKGHSEAWPIWL